jgi:hypothetical protein
VFARQFEQRPAPVTRSSEIGDHDDEAVLLGECPGSVERLAERGCAGARLVRLSSQRSEKADETHAALPGW